MTKAVEEVIIREKETFSHKTPRKISYELVTKFKFWGEN